MRLRPYAAIALTLTLGGVSADSAFARTHHPVGRTAPPATQAEPAQTPQPAPRPAPQSPETSAAQSTNEKPAPAIGLYQANETYLRAPVTTLLPGDPPPQPPIDNPVKGDPQALQRGMSYFTTFNCVGCHAPNGGGGMGPALSNRIFIYGGEPVNIYLSIYHGRPNGMPAWGAMLSNEIIWDLVAYVESISQAPSKGWGRTISRDALKIEQTPAEFIETAKPWSYTQRFNFGQKPGGRRP
ncbi:c-type cytochrome [Methylocystis sp. SC2]|uniref:c-type cytochrome n=1 Tax=Methylocystis sp. (strain SC2) TaxID=187303 RepID=UPI00027AE790|nr:c-type cytochrome [Methylocystis sp. SC2]CCJ08485.1 Di-heme cytochrome c [Methylocystis sp. SC2]